MNRSDMPPTLTQPSQVEHAITATSPGSVGSHAFGRLPEFIVVQSFVVFGGRIIEHEQHGALCARCCLSRVVYCYGQEPSRARAIIHSAVECISHAVRYRGGEMERRWRGDVVTEVRDESVMDNQNRCCRRKDP
jgi:hypothetical protein